jgi:hypothetical protein
MSIIERIISDNPNAILWDDLNDAVIGISDNLCAVYDIDKIIDCLQKNNDWNEEDAYEWLGYNILNAYVGEFTPIHIYTK